MRAVTRPLADFVDEVPDLNDIAGDHGVLFVRGGVGLAGRGVAARVAIDDVVAFLAAIEHDSSVEQASVLAVGSVPFRPGDPADVLVPEVCVVKRDGAAWVTAIDGADVESALSAPPDPTPSAPAWTIDHEVAVDHYLAAVATARDAVRAGDLTKAVIARPIRVAADAPIGVHAVLRRLKATFSSSFRFSVDGFIGASPELLVEVDGPWCDPIRSPAPPRAPVTSTTMLGSPPNSRRAPRTRSNTGW